MVIRPTCEEIKEVYIYIYIMIRTVPGTYQTPSTFCYYYSSFAITTDYFLI